jgi:hypothetical protein
MKVSKGFIKRHLPPIVFTEEDDPGIFNTVIARKERRPSQYISQSTHKDKAREPDDRDLPTRDNCETSVIHYELFETTETTE